MKTKVSSGEISKLVESRNGKILEEKYVNGRRAFKLKCNKCGHEWTSYMFNIKNGKWCLKCYKKATVISDKEIRNLVHKAGYSILNKEELNRKSKFKVNCAIHDFTWETEYGNFKYGSSGRCRLCASGTQAIQEVKKVINSKGGELVEIIYGNKVKYKIRCNKHNYEWITNWYNLAERNAWCYLCSLDDRKIKYKEIKEEVESNGGILLTKKASTAVSKFKVKCRKCDHEWSTTWSRIKQGCWCPKCKGPKMQRHLYRILKKIFVGANFEYNYRNFDWLKFDENSKNNMEIDILIRYKDLCLAVEYDGEQHFRPVKFSSYITEEKAKSNFKYIQKRDIMKDKLIAEHPEEISYFIRFNYKDKINKDNVMKKLLEYDVPILK